MTFTKFTPTMAHPAQAITPPSFHLKLEPLKFFDDFKLKTASKHPFLKQAIHFNFLNFFLESNCRIF
jgi:hypothetical protein